MRPPPRPLHEALEVSRAVFARKMDIALAHFFVAAEEGVLPDKPARVAAQQVGVDTRVAQRRCAGVVSGRSWPDFIEMPEEVPGILLNQRIITGE